ncbi:hypothetical protein EDC04DRAFT_2544774, partial [Pisolithus marmoratus]
LDLSPTQWYLSAKAMKPCPLSIWSFILQLLAFINTYVTTENENMLAAFRTL